jgi:hypothetical protein
MNMGSELAKGFSRFAQAPTSGTQAITARHGTGRIAQAIFGHIVVYLGPFTATSAMSACCQALGREQDSVELVDAPQLLAALRPMLATLLGGASCRILLRRIERDLRI